MTTNTRLEYLTALVDRLYPDKYQRRGTASATGSTTTIVDTDAFSSSALFKSDLVGQWIWVNTADTTGKAAQITVHDRSTGTITLDRAVTSTTTSTTWWLTFERHPQELFDAISQLMRNIFTPRLFPLTSFILLDGEVADNDMSTSTSTAWTSTGATANKAVSTIPVLWGVYYLDVSGNAAEYVSGTSWYVTEGHQYWANILAATKVSDRGTFQIYDLTNSAAIESATTDERDWVWLNFYFTPPSGCESITARLVCPDASSTNYWRDISVINCEQKIFRTPEWIQYASQMIDVVEVPYGPVGPGGADEYRAWENMIRPVTWRPAFNTIQSSSTHLTLEVPSFNAQPRYIYAMGPESALSTDAATAHFAVDVIAENALTILKHPDRADRFLRVLRESSMNAPVSTPKSRAMAHFA